MGPDFKKILKLDFKSLCKYAGLVVYVKKGNKRQRSRFVKGKRRERPWALATN